jgi:hypothetical protein
MKSKKRMNEKNNPSKNGFRLGLVVISILLCCYNLHAQVTIGSDTPPEPGALLDLRNKPRNAENNATADKGLLLPRVRLNDMKAINGLKASIDSEDSIEWYPDKLIGLMVYNVEESQNISEGIYVWNGTEWKNYNGKSEISGSGQSVTDLNLTLKIPRPERGERPVLWVDEFQYSGPVEWFDYDDQPFYDTFVLNDQYYLMATLTAKSGWAFDGTELIHEDAESVSSSAYNEMATVTIIFNPTGQNTPIDYGDPSFDLSNYIRKPVTGGAPVKSFGNGYYSGTVKWFCLEKFGEPIGGDEMPDSIFMPGIKYEAKVTLTPIPGNYFDSDPIRLNYGKQQVKFSDETAGDGKRTAHIVFDETGELPVTDTDLTTKIPRPEIGEKPTLEFEWFQYTGTVKWEPSHTTFLNTAYTATVTLTAQPGFSFKNLTIPFAHRGANSVMPGEKSKDGQTLSSVTINFDMAGQSLISKEGAFDLTPYIRKPVAGGTPVASFSNGNYAGVVEWNKLSDTNSSGNSNGSSSISSAIQEEETDELLLFRSGTQYQAKVTLTPAPGFYFDSEKIKFEYNGQEITLTGTDGELTGNIEFEKTTGYDQQEQEVTDTDLTTKIPQPEEGMTAITEFEWFQYKGNVMWKEDGVTHDKNATFKRGKIYTATVKLTAQHGFFFNNVNNFTYGGVNSKVTVTQGNRPDDDRQSLNDIIITFPAIPEIPVIQITDTDLTTKIPQPEEGKTAITEFEWFQYKGTAVKWTTTDTDPTVQSLQSGLKFERGKTYIAEVTLTAKPGFTFNDVANFTHYDANSVKQQVNPADNGQIKITITFPKTVADKQIDDKDLTTKIPQPQEGRIPSIQFEWFQYEGDTITWKEKNGPEHKAGDPFKRGKAYTATVTLKAKPGFTLAGVTEDFFRHNYADVVSHDAYTDNKKTLDVTIEFPVTVVDIPVYDLNLTLNIPRPVLWREPIWEYTTPQYSFEIKWSYKKPNGTNEFIQKSDKPVFESNLYYMAAVTLKTAEGYTFKADSEQPIPVAFRHNEGDLEIINPADADNWKGKDLELTIGFPVTGVPRLAKFSGAADNNTEGSVIDLIRETAKAKQNSLHAVIEATEELETVKFDNSTDLGTTGLVLNRDATNPSPAALSIDGNGLVVDLIGQKSDAPLITVGSGVTLTLQNITFKGLDGNDGNNGNNAPVIKVKDGGILIMGVGSKIANNKNISDGGGDGGGIIVDKGGTLTINTGAEVSDNEAVAGGGVHSTGTFILNGGRISGNTVSTSGGGVLVIKETGEFRMDGGYVNNNSAVANGGGVHVKDRATFRITVNGGYIQENRAGGGGGVYIVDPGSTFFMEGGLIGKNTAGIGGGVYVDGSADIFTMSGYNPIIKDNTATEKGGGVYTKCPFEMNSGSIIGNTATDGGGGVYVDSEAMFTLNSGSIMGNVVKNKNGKGGGVYVEDADLARTHSGFNMKNGSISGNGIYPAGTETDGLGKGAGVYVNVTGKFTKTGGTIHGAMKSNGDAWEIMELQNYYRWAIDNDGTEVTYSDPNVPGGDKTGYAVNFEYTKHHLYNIDGNAIGSPEESYRKNNTLTGSLCTFGGDERKEGWDSKIPNDPIMVQDGDINEGTWAEVNDAVNECNAEDDAPYHDWRLPSIDELRALYNNRNEKGIGNVPTGVYWSSSFDEDEDHNNMYWVLDFGNGKEELKKSHEINAKTRCVRDYYIIELNP